MPNLKTKYLREIQKLLPYLSAQKKYFIAELENSVSVYLDTHTNATMASLYSEFGTPQDIAATYLNEVNPSNVSRSFSIKKILGFVIAAAVVIITIVICVFFFILKDDIQDLHDGYYVDTIIESSNEPLPIPSSLTIS